MVISKSAYKDHLMGFWLGSCIGNWTGLPTENRRVDFPFFTDDDFGEGKFNFVLDQDPWGADDDTDIEYIYQLAMEQNNSPLLTPSQISAAWQKHIGLPLLWVSNLAALTQMQNGALPPNTSHPDNNPMWEMIDAQLTTELFGALAPSRPDIGLKLAHLPIRTTAYAHSEWAAEFYVIMHTLAVTINSEKSRKDEILRISEIARKYIPDSSYIADMYDFVYDSYLKNPDKSDWEKTRDMVANRYQYNNNAGYIYQYPWDSGINFAASIISLLYGEGDFKRTLAIASMCGWDSDNPTATWGGFLGLLMGFDELKNLFDYNFSTSYNIARTRYNTPLKIDNFDDMANRGLKLIDAVVQNQMNGSLDNDHWIIPQLKNEPTIASTVIKEDPWQTIEDNDESWSYTGFEIQQEQWNASGATLSVGKSNCTAEITFDGKAIQLFSYRSIDAGSMKIYLDDEFIGNFNLSTTETYGQYYFKVFEKTALEHKSHTLKIIGDQTLKPKTIDLIRIKN
ncbi:MAG: ADP-ribosylglycohydrolase family protein [Flavobacteriaceae bacterium]|nr:ADP-ribosylglycohydrolase family protein [Flavobacteriaceae bacterium]